MPMLTVVIKSKSFNWGLTKNHGQAKAKACDHVATVTAVALCSALSSVFLLSSNEKQ